MRIICPTMMMMMTFKEVAREIREDESHHHRPRDPTKQKRDATTRTIRTMQKSRSCRRRERETLFLAEMT
jgi:hypothetical protein